MADTQYELRYLPLFYEDLEQKVIYISETLHNEKAANDLLDAVEKAIMERLPIAETFELYRSVKERQYKYYRIYVKNFVIYYVVIDIVVYVVRILHMRVDSRMWLYRMFGL